VRLSGRASARAATADMAAVRSAVVSVNSLRSSGMPVSTSASTPNAITVGRPKRLLPGVAVDVLERVGFGVGIRHQFDHAIFGVAGHAGAFVEIVPAQESRPGCSRHAAQCFASAGFSDDGGHVGGH
jgi:hypothetical protein